MPFANLDSDTIYYAARGTSGAPLVFIHGAGDSHLVWNGQVAACADIAQAMALDLPGHGRSTGAPRPTVAEYARVIRDFLDARGIAQATIVGTSMGGAIAQMVALDYPERVAGLGLVATGAKLRVAPAFLSGFDENFEKTAQLLVENYYADFPPDDLVAKSLGQLMTSGAAVTRNDYAACDVFDVRERLGEIRAPTLVLCGRADRMTPVKYSEYLAAHILHAELSIIEHAGHMVMLEQPAQINDALRTWLAKLG
jgi:pimeloyl-ACP methyl ester carboxylesterase